MRAALFIIFVAAMACSRCSAQSVRVSVIDRLEGEAQPGDTEAQYLQGMQLDDRGDYEQAVQWYRRAANAGYAPAQVNLGRLYDRGRGVTQDKSEAVRWYRRAAEQGNVDGEFDLAASYALGEVVAKDGGEALRWFSLAVD